MKEKSEYLLIIDGSSLLATSYYSSLPKAIRKEKDEEKKKELYPRLLKKDRKGRYCNALESFFHTIFTIMTFQHPTHLAICWDVSRHTFRKELWPSYKSNRSVTPEPLSQQYETAYEICAKLKMAQFRDQDYEADDFAGSLAVQLEKALPVRILTRDKDYFQLITPRTRIWYGMSDLAKVRQWRQKHDMPHGLPSRVVEVNPAVLEAEFGYSPSCVCMMKALFGDRSDNIPGVRGMGETRSIALARHYDSPDALYEAISKASDRRSRNALVRTWRSWGIQRSPYSCLTRQKDGDRPSSQEMAQLCYTLGKMKTDIDLSVYCPGSQEVFTKNALRYVMPYQKAAHILSQYDIDLKVGSRRPFGRQGSEENGPASAALSKQKNGTRTSSGTRLARSTKSRTSVSSLNGTSAQGRRRSKPQNTASNPSSRRSSGSNMPAQSDAMQSNARRRKRGNAVRSQKNAQIVFSPSETAIPVFAEAGTVKTSKPQNSRRRRPSSQKKAADGIAKNQSVIQAQSAADSKRQSGSRSQNRRNGRRRPVANRQSARPAAETAAKQIQNSGSARPAENGTSQKSTQSQTAAMRKERSAGTSNGRAQSARKTKTGMADRNMQPKKSDQQSSGSVMKSAENRKPAGQTMNEPSGMQKKNSKNNRNKTGKNRKRYTGNRTRLNTPVSEPVPAGV